MKRSNLFLALTTGCLAVVSFAFAKSHQKSAVNSYCKSGSICTVATAKTAYFTVALANHKAKCAQTGHVGQTVHSTVNGACGQTLYTKSTD